MFTWCLRQSTLLQHYLFIFNSTLVISLGFTHDVIRYFQIVFNNLRHVHLYNHVQWLT